MRHNIKRILAAGIIAAMSIGSCFTAFGATKLYSETTTSTVTKGVDYIYDHRLTADGFQNVHVLKIDLQADNIKLAPIESVNEYGKKETVLSLVNDNGAIAGVNGDFFGLTGNYSASFGPVIRDGELISAGTDRNINSNEYSSFFLKDDGNAFLQYFKFNIKFLANGIEYFEMASVNKITEMIYPIYFDRNAADNTRDLDARFSGLVKIVVENGMITYISQKGETVNVPENGYLIILSSSYADSYIGEGKIAVGQSADVQITASADISHIEAAIGGAGTILVNGSQATNPGLVIAGRQPRTALGISQDGKTLILMVVDGRGVSIGATQEEMAQLMKEYGAYNAMHLDGGGSSTMVVKESDEDTASVKNQVSDGSQRKVMNSLAVIDTAEVGEMTELVVRPSSERVFVGDTVTIEAFGYDEYYHKIEINDADVVYSTEYGSFSSNKLTASQEGEITIYGGYSGLSATTTIDVMQMASISPNTSELSLAYGQTAQLSVSGLSTQGFSGSLKNGVTYSVSDPALGTISGNTFTAGQTTGTGYIKCSFNGYDCYIKLSVGGEEKGISSFDNVGNKMTFSSYPTSITGSIASVSDVVANGEKALELKYNFAEASTTQAAYLNFTDPVVIEKPASEITLSIYGNNSGAWVRGKLIDADGNDVIIDFTKDMNWDGWKDVTATIPSNTKFPVKFQTVYVAALSNSNTAEQKVYFDYMRAVMPVENNEEIPADTKIPDVHKEDITDKQEGSYYINVLGTVSSGTVEDIALYESERAKAAQTIENQADLAIYAGKNDIQQSANIDTIKWSSTYGFYQKNGVDIVQLTATNGGLRNTYAAQWATFKNDVLNSSNKNVIFIMNRTPSDFTDGVEMALFRSALDDIREAGKTVFVVSASGTSAWDTVKDGIRYINLPDLWNGKNLNTNFSMARFKITDGYMTYDIEKLY